MCWDGQLLRLYMHWEILQKRRLFLPEFGVSELFRNKMSHTTGNTSSLPDTGSPLCSSLLEMSWFYYSKYHISEN